MRRFSLAARAAPQPETDMLPGAGAPVAHPRVGGRQGHADDFIGRAGVSPKIWLGPKTI
jgi:hypothetical protein